MKHGVKPNRAQRKVIERVGMNPCDWLVVKDTPNEIVLIHRNSDDKLYTIQKERIPLW